MSASAASGQSEGLDSSAYFARREHELLLLNMHLDEQKKKALSAAAAAVERSQSLLQSEVKGPNPNDSFGMPSPTLIPDLTLRPHSSSALPGVTLAPSGQELESLQATVRYQKARVVALQEELDRVVKAAQEREAETLLLRNEMKVAVDENRRLLKKLNGVESDLERMAKRSAGWETKMSLIEEELAEEKRQHEKDLGVVRRLEQEARAKEVKTTRLIEENERLKVTVREAKASERERGGLDQELQTKMQSDLKRLTKQRAELISAFKKQARLIDILRRQKVHLEAARLLTFTEEEFIRSIGGVGNN